MTKGTNKTQDAPEEKGSDLPAAPTPWDIVEWVARDRFGSTVLCSLLALPATALTFLLINHFADGGRAHYVGWSQYSEKELKQAYSLATGQDDPPNGDAEPGESKLLEEMREETGISIRYDPRTDQDEEAAASASGISASSPPARVIRFYWSAPSPPEGIGGEKLIQELVLERVSNDPLVVRASFYPRITTGEKSFEELGVRKRTIAVSDFPVVTEMSIPFPLLGLRPVSASSDGEALARRFFPLMEKNARGLVEGGNQRRPSGDMEEKATALLTELLNRRVGEPLVSETNDELAIPDGEHSASPADASYSAVRYKSPGDLIWIQQLFNGSDGWGVIQYGTVIVFYCLMVNLAAKIWSTYTQGKYLQLAEDNDPLFSRLAMDERNSESIRSRMASIEKLGAQYGEGRSCAPVDLSATGHSALLHERDVLTAVKGRADLMLEQIGTNYSTVRLLSWMMPSIGFLGTVIGIGAALSGTSRVLAGDDLDRQASIGAMSQSLGTAFNTTFVALAASVITMPLVHLAQKGDEQLVLDSADRTCQSLLGLELHFFAEREQAPPAQATGEGQSQKEVPKKPRREARHMRESKPRLQPVRIRWGASLFVALLAVGLFTLSAFALVQLRSADGLAGTVAKECAELLAPTSAD